MLDPNDPDILCGGGNRHLIMPSIVSRPVRFMLLTHPRTGTQMVANALEGYACLRWFNLYASCAADDKAQAHYNWSKYLWQDHPAGVTHLGTTMHRVGEGWVEKFTGFSFSGYWAMVANSYDRCVCLYRRNLLRQLLSRKVGVMLRSCDVLSPRDTKPSPGPIEIGLPELDLFVTSMENLRAYTDAYFHNTSTVAYEDLLTNWEGSLRTIQEYLGLPPNPMPPFTHRQERRRLSDAISNYDEVAKWAENNDHLDWLGDE